MIRSKNFFVPKKNARKVKFLVPESPIPAEYRKLMDKYKDSQQRIMMRGVK